MKSSIDMQMTQNSVFRSELIVDVNYGKVIEVGMPLVTGGGV